MTAILGLSALVAFSPSAAATFTDQGCGQSTTASNWNFNLGWSDQTGWVLKDMKFLTYYRIKWMNIPWVDLDTTVAGVTYLTTAPTTMCSWDNAGKFGFADSWYNFSSTQEGIVNPHVHIETDYNDNSQFYVNVTLEGTASKKSAVSLYVDWEINPTGTGMTDGSDDGIEVNTVYSGQYFAEQRTESDMRGASWLKWYIVEANGPVSDYHGMMDSWFTANDESKHTVVGYALACTSCSDVNGQYQWHDGPWDFLNAGSTYNNDIQLTLSKQRIVTTVATNYRADFLLKAY